MESDSELDRLLRGVAAAPPEPPPTDRIGETIGRYRLVGLLGRGGMGAVYEADDTELGRRVALKLVRVDARDRGDAQDRFRRERALTSELEHPNIMPVYDAGSSPAGEPYYVMRVARGESLDRHIARADAIEARLALVPNLVSVSDAIAFAHSRGIVHRDLKPHNILIGAFGETLVADWGLAKRLHRADEAISADAGLARSPIETRLGRIQGTPAYMAPEQASGGPTDERTDVYALGALLFYVLARVPPAGSLAVAGVPADLLAIATKALAREPRDRYPGAQAFADELRRFLAGNIVSARVYSRSELVRRWSRRHRAELAVAAPLGLVLVAVGIASVVRIVQERDRAEHQRAAAETARAQLAERNDALVLLEARAELTRDPTAAIAWLASYPAASPHWDVVATTAADAASRGVARAVWDLGRPVGSIAFSPDSRELAAGAADGTFVMIDVATGARRSFHADDGVGDRVVASPDGTLYATGDGHEVVRLWDRATGQSRRLARERAGGSNLRFSFDSAFVTTRQVGGGARVWRRDGTAVALPGSDDDRLVAFVGRTRTVAIASGRLLALVELDTGKQLQTATLESHPYDLQASGDGTWIGATRFDALDAWNPQTGVVRRVTPAKRAVALITASEDGASMMSCGHQERELWQFDLAAGSTRLVSTGERCFRQGFSFSPDSATFVSLGFGTEIRLHHLHEHVMTRLSGHAAVVTDAVFSPDGRWLASSSADHTVRLWPLDPGDLRVLHETREIDRVSSSGRLLVEDRRGVAVIDVQTGERSALVAPPARLHEGCMSRDGRVVALYGADRQLVVYDLAAGTRRVLPAIAGLSIDDNAPTACSSAGDRLAQVDGHGVVRIVDLGDGSARTLARLGDAGFSLLYADDDRALAIGSRDRALIVLDPETGTQRRRVALPAIPWNMTWSNDGRRVALPCTDGVIRIVDVTTGAMRELQGHVGAATGASFAPDGVHLLSAGSDATIRRWNLETGAGAIVRRESAPIASLNVVGRSSTIVHRCGDASLVRVWDASSLPPDTAAPGALRAWMRRVTTASVDAGGAVASPAMR
jgi:eukaryotic-like serine/threonine-protein kinase